MNNNKPGRKNGFKHSIETIERMKTTKAETSQRKNEIDIRIDFLKNYLYSVSKINHQDAINLIYQFDDIIKNYKKNSEYELNTMSILQIQIENTPQYLNTDDAFANLELLCNDEINNEDE